MTYNYKCNECNHKWTSNEEANICPNPNCGSGDITPTGKFDKRWLLLLLLIIPIVFIPILFRNETTIKVDYDKNSQKLMVELTGKKADQYEIIVTRDDDEYKKSKTKTKQKFSFTFDVCGTYRLRVNWDNKIKSEPERKWIGEKGPWEIICVEDTPHILAINIVSKDYNAQKYKISIETDTAKVKFEDTEYSMDSATYQNSKEFNVSSGEHTFYARNKNKNSLISEGFTNELPPIDPTLSSDSINRGKTGSGIVKGTKTYPFGKYTGELQNGIPHGQGKMSYTKRVQIAKHSEKIYWAEKGDVFEGKWHNGDIEFGQLKDKNNLEKATLRPGRRPLTYDISKD